MKFENSAPIKPYESIYTSEFLQNEIMKRKNNIIFFMSVIIILKCGSVF